MSDKISRLFGLLDLIADLIQAVAGVFKKKKSEDEKEEDKEKKSE